jgi:hypothetical protein
MSEYLQPPSDTPDYAYGMWASAMMAALKNDDIFEAFKRDTGLTCKPGRSGIERMIDEATGFDRKLAEGFCKWFNENVWGEWG